MPEPPSSSAPGDRSGIRTERRGGALARLLAANALFREGREPAGRSPQALRRLVAGQHPWAAVVACSDSRVAPELVFAVGFGELFVMRSAGNVVDACTVASVTFAVEELHVPLVAVMGHTCCGGMGCLAAVLGGGDTACREEFTVLLEQAEPLRALCPQRPGEPLSQWADRLARENARLQAGALLARCGPLRDRWLAGSTEVAALVLDLDSGRAEVVEELLPGQGP